MPKRVIVVMIVAVAVIVAVALIASLGRDRLDTDEVRAYADPMTEDMLVAMNEEDYALFSEHLDETMKAAIPEEHFGEFVELFKDTIGDYVSKDFLNAGQREGGILVSYEAEYTDEPDDVVVQVFFLEVDGEMHVLGIWFDSPKLRQLG